MSQDPHTRIATLPQDEEAPKQDKLSERITTLGDEICRADFQWACQQLHPLLRQRYAETEPSWSTAVRQAIFFVPMMAALAKARDQVTTALTIENHKQELLELLRSSEDDDPLHLVTGDQSLRTLQDAIRSNIGRRKRAIAFFAWLQYFAHGAAGDYPIDWSIGEAFRD